MTTNEWVEFIEVTTLKYGKRFVNVNIIEEVVPKENTCIIYFAFSCPHAEEQDYYEVNENYEEVKSMILNANIKVCNCAVH